MITLDPLLFLPAPDSLDKALELADEIAWLVYPIAQHVTRNATDGEQDGRKSQ